MSDIKQIPLISSEIGGLWTSYMSDTMIKCMLSHFLNHVECEETRAILQQTLDLSNQHIQELATLFKVEELPIPNGFTDSDVKVDAPRLFNDAFYLQYLGYISRASMHNYTLMLNEMARSDIRAYFSKRINENIDLYNSSADLRLSKGIFIRAPRVEVTKEVQYVKSITFMTDWFGEKRPMITGEITHIFATIFANIVGKAIMTGFGQISKEKKNFKYFFEGKEIATEQISELTTILTDEDIPIPSTSDSYVTNSTVAPFSEKLMINHTVMLASSGISYLKYTAVDMKYAKDGADILIDNGWLEQPPQAVRHENLVWV